MVSASARATPGSVSSSNRDKVSTITPSATRSADLHAAIQSPSALDRRRRRGEQVVDRRRRPQRCDRDRSDPGRPPAAASHPPRWPVPSTARAPSTPLGDRRERSRRADDRKRSARCARSHPPSRSCRAGAASARAGRQRPANRSARRAPTRHRRPRRCVRRRRSTREATRSPGQHRIAGRSGRRGRTTAARLPTEEEGRRQSPSSGSRNARFSCTGPRAACRPGIDVRARATTTARRRPAPRGRGTTRRGVRRDRSGRWSAERQRRGVPPVDRR